MPRNLKRNQLKNKTYLKDNDKHNRDPKNKFYSSFQN